MQINTYSLSLLISQELLKQISTL